MQSPADPGRQLLSLRAGQEHAELQGPDELILRDPSTPYHHLAMQNRNLSRGTTKADAADFHPKPNGFEKGRRFFHGKESVKQRQLRRGIGSSCRLASCPGQGRSPLRIELRLFKVDQDFLGPFDD